MTEIYTQADFVKKFVNSKTQTLWDYSNRCILVDRTGESPNYFFFLKKTWREKISEDEEIVKVNYTFLFETHDYQTGFDEAMKSWDKKTEESIEGLNETDFLEHIEQVIFSTVSSNKKRDKNPTEGYELKDFLFSLEGHVYARGNLLRKFDFSVVFVGKDGKEHAWYPETSRLVEHHKAKPEEHQEPVYLEFLSHPSYLCLRDRWDKVGTTEVPSQQKPGFDSRTTKIGD